MIYIMGLSLFILGVVCLVVGIMLEKRPEGKFIKKSSNRIKIIALGASILVFLLFGFIDNGKAYWQGSMYDTDSVFLPAKYLNNGVYSNWETDALNKYLGQKRAGSMIMVILSGVTAGVLGFLLYKEDEVKDLLLYYREEARKQKQAQTPVSTDKENAPSIVETEPKVEDVEKTEPLQSSETVEKNESVESSEETVASDNTEVEE